MKKHFPVGCEAAGLMLAVLLFSGILQATPITNMTDGQSSGSTQLVTSSSVSGVAKAPVAISVSVPRPRVAAAIPTICTFGSDCSKKVQVPEPQSLVMVGTGLLSMAGLIRRRLLRQG